MQRWWLASSVLLALSAVAWAQAPQAPKDAAPYKAEAVLSGQLARQNSAPVLKVKDKAYRLAAANEYAKTILNEERVAGWEFRLEGRWKGSDTFEVERLFSVHDGKLFKVTYYCDVCNITTYKPGRCDCCQDPTEVREVPANPEGIY